jgi:hypothetical protein
MREKHPMSFEVAQAFLPCRIADILVGWHSAVQRLLPQQVGKPVHPSQ